MNTNEFTPVGIRQIEGLVQAIGESRMVDAAGFSGLLTTVNWLYWVLAALVVWRAWRQPVTRRNKIASAALVSVLFLALPASRAYHFASYKWKYHQAKALFDERCKTAGEKIYKTVEGVEGVLLMNLRPDKVPVADQFARYDPYGYDGGGEDYIKSFLPGYWRLCTGQNCPAQKQAFKFVEAKTDGGAIFRYTTVDKETGNQIAEGRVSGVRLNSKLEPESEAMFGLQWEDISTDQDRQAWIAGGKITIYEMDSMTVVAERVGFLMDAGQGGTGGGRSPWSWARQYTEACPTVAEHNAVFARKVLKSY
jgi:hypothetical protein